MLSFQYTYIQYILRFRWNLHLCIGQEVEAAWIKQEAYDPWRLCSDGHNSSKAHLRPLEPERLSTRTYGFTLLQLYQNLSLSLIPKFTSSHVLVRAPDHTHYASCLRINVHWSRTGASWLQIVCFLKSWWAFFIMGMKESKEAKKVIQHWKMYYLLSNNNTLPFRSFILQEWRKIDH